MQISCRIVKITTRYAPNFAKKKSLELIKLSSIKEQDSLPVRRKQVLSLNDSYVVCSNENPGCTTRPELGSTVQDDDTSCV